MKFGGTAFHKSWQLCLLASTTIAPLPLVAASQIFDLGESKENTMDFAEALDESDLSEFGFTDSFVFELWGAITDAKSGR